MKIQVVWVRENPEFKDLKIQYFQSKWANEDIVDTAKRELQEETGAIDFNMEPITIYSVTGKNSVNSNENETFGMLFYAEVHSLNDTLENEIEQIKFFNKMPVNLTYPEIQPYLYNKVIEIKGER